MCSVLNDENKLFFPSIKGLCKIEMRTIFAAENRQR